MNTTPPTVVQLKRNREGIVQDCTLYIGNAWNMGGWKLDKSKWANPFRIKKFNKIITEQQKQRFLALTKRQQQWVKNQYEIRQRNRVLAQYEEHIRTTPHLLNSLNELNGHVLGCWCVDIAHRETPNTLVCHGEVLVMLWNKYSN